MTFVSYAQNLEDVVLWRALQRVGDRGFYIDVGAWYPEEDSVTLAFYERGWSGVNVEPDEVVFAALQAARPRDINLRLALGAEPGEAPFYRFPGTGWSTLDPDIAARHGLAGHAYDRTRVRIETLESIFRHHAPDDVHFLKIDVEGAEAAVLAGMDFERYRPWILLVEATYPNSTEASHQAWESALLKAGYTFAYFDGVNRFYVANERCDALRPALANPPNVFDGYVSATNLRKVYREGVQIPGVRDALIKVRADEARVAAEAAARIATAEASFEAEATARVAMEARAAEAEMRALAAEREARFLQADLAQLAALTRPPTAPADSNTAAQGFGSDGAVVSAPPSLRIFIDASLMIFNGLQPPVGLVRVEHYVAAFLASDPSVALHFVVYDRDRTAYRPLSGEEQRLLQQILFHRYKTDLVAELPDMQPSDVTPAPRRSVRLRSRIGRVCRMSRTEFKARSATFIEHRFPLTPNQPALARVGIRGARALARGAARRAHSGVRVAVHLRRWLTRLAAPDASLVDATAAAPAPPRRVQVSAMEKVPQGPQPGPGDVLVCMANMWDYMDYGYLDRLCRRDGVRLVSVIYDVIVMELPFTSVQPPHVLHRHWVELGHLSSHLLAISLHTANSYQRLIAEPNDLPAPISQACLPNFLEEHAATIGEVPVADLDGRPFVVYCSTIEIRKNHQLLLNVWDRLQHEISSDRVPLLVFVGRWGWHTEIVRLLIERNWRLRAHLRVLDGVPDAQLIWLYRNARFTVFPSHSEGYGLAAAESLSFGTPVVVSDCPALLEATEGLMPAHDPQDFVAWYDEIRSLATDDARIDELRAVAGRYRGPAYEEFACAVRDAARAAVAC